MHTFASRRPFKVRDTDLRGMQSANQLSNALHLMRATLQHFG